VQKKDTILWETKETAAIVVFTDLPNRQFAYALENGTIGVYEAGQRLWRVKVKCLNTGEILTMAAFSRESSFATVVKFFNMIDLRI